MGGRIGCSEYDDDTGSRWVGYSHGRLPFSLASCSISDGDGEIENHDACFLILFVKYTKPLLHMEWDLNN